MFNHHEFQLNWKLITEVAEFHSNEILAMESKEFPNQNVNQHAKLWNKKDRIAWKFA